MSEGRIRTAVVIALSALTLSACGGTELLLGHRGGGSRVSVVKGWSQALVRGDVRRAAGYFRLPSVFANAGQIARLRTRQQVESINESLPCGAQFVSAVRDGRYLNVLFRLVVRRGPGGGATACGSGVGQSARTAFLIRDGKIVQWVRAPSRPGDPGVPAQGSPV